MSRHSVSLVFDSGEGFRPAEDAFKLFDPFFSAEGIFHDVFEHYFEFTGRFKDCTSIWGEMMATAHKIWLWDNINFSAFEVRNSKPHLRMSYREDTEDYVLVTYDHDTFSFDWPDIPKDQRPTQGMILETAIRDYKEYVEDLSDWLCPITRREFIQRMRDSYRFGYRMAYKRFGHVPKQKLYDQLTEFLWGWHHFVQAHQKSIEYIYIHDSHSTPLCELRGLKVVSHLGTKDCIINQYAIGTTYLGNNRAKKFDVPGDILSTL